MSFMNNQLFDDVENRWDKIQIYYNVIRISTKPSKAIRILRNANARAGGSSGMNTLTQYLFTIVSQHVGI